MKTIWGLAPPLRAWTLEALMTFALGPPRLPPELVKLIVDWTALPRVSEGKVTTDDEPEGAPAAKIVLLMTLAPPWMVTAPRVKESDRGPASTESVPPVKETAPVPIREPETLVIPLLSKVSWPKRIATAPVVVRVALSRSTRAPPRTESAPLPRLPAATRVRLLEPCFSKLILPPVIAPEKVVAVLSCTTRSVAAEVELLVTEPDPLA